jgi:tetratricopeptide (TPR) repeat protein
MPNLTFLYINIGQNYREISTKTDLNYWDLALEYFDRAARINQTLTGVNDPLPYVGIANTYERMGEFFIAAINLEKAIEINPTEAVLYGNLALVRFKARNYEGSIPMFECAINGCEIVLDTLLGPTLLEDSNREDYVGEETYLVEGIPLGNDSYVFYFSYGSVLAALDLCDEAIPVLTQVGNAYPDDDVVTSIVDEGFTICDYTP